MEINRKDPSLKSEVVKAVCALGNSKGGIVYIGISDDKEIKGIQRDLDLYNPTNRANATREKIKRNNRILSGYIAYEARNLLEKKHNVYNLNSLAYENYEIFDIY